MSANKSKAGNFAGIFILGDAGTHCPMYNKNPCRVLGNVLNTTMLQITFNTSKYEF